MIHASRAHGTPSQAPLRDRLLHRGSRIALNWAPAWLSARWRRYPPDRRRLFAAWLRATVLGYLLVVAVDYAVFLAVSFLYTSSFARVMGFTLRGFSRSAWLDALAGMFIGTAQLVVLRGTGRWRRTAFWWPVVMFGGLFAADAIGYALGSIPLSDRFQNTGEQRLQLAGVFPSGLWRLATTASGGAIAGLVEGLFLAAAASPALEHRRHPVRTWLLASTGAVVASDLAAQMLRPLGAPPDVWPKLPGLAYSVLSGLLVTALGGLIVGASLATALIAILQPEPPTRRRRFPG